MHPVIRQIVQHFRFTSQRKRFAGLRIMLFRRWMTRLVHPVGLGTLPLAARFERKPRPHAVLVHISHGPASHTCACNCPDGYCEHVWDGPAEEGQGDGGGFYSSATCSRCGKSAISHDMWVF